MSRLISEQLTPALSMSLKPGSPPRSSGCNHSSGHCSHMHSRARTRIFAGVVLLLTVTIILALSVSNPGVAAHAFVKGGWSDGSLLRRAVSDSGSSNSDSPFIKNKLYLIVIIVGLFVCLILAIMLSAWCCKGAFENPLCCPCYLCACCGGLACLECIGCGLCADAADQF